MSDTLAPTEPRIGPSPLGPTVARAVAGVLLVLWVGVLVATVLLGHRTSTWAQLREDVASGTASEIQVTGGLSEGGRGYALVQVRWRSGWIGRTTEVLEARPRSTAGTAHRSEVSAVLADRGVTDRLAEIDPGITVERVGYGGWESTWLGWARPGWLLWVQLGAVVATFGLLGLAPSPRRATPWAWCWLVLVASPPGAIAYLLLSGVLRRGVTPTSGRMLTGGWAFLLAVGLRSAFGG